MKWATTESGLEDEKRGDRLSAEKAPVKVRAYINTARLTKKMSVETMGEPASLGSREKGRRCIQVSPPLPAPLLPTQTKENINNP